MRVSTVPPLAGCPIFPQLARGSVGFLEPNLLTCQPAAPPLRGCPIQAPLGWGADSLTCEHARSAANLLTCQPAAHPTRPAP